MQCVRCVLSELHTGRRPVQRVRDEELQGAASATSAPTSEPASQRDAAASEPAEPAGADAAAYAVPPR